MNLEQLHEQWRQLDAKIDRALELDLEILRAANVPPIRQRIHRWAFWPSLDILFAAFVLVFFGNFAFNHVHELAMLLPAMLVMGAGILLILTSVLQLKTVFGIDWDGPIFQMQSEMEKLHIAKIRQFKWVILCAPLVGFCALLVVLQSILDYLPQKISILDKIDSTWLLANAIFGVLFVPVAYGIALFMARNFGHRTWWQRTLDDISGRTIHAARRDLRRWSEVGDLSATPGD